MEITGQDKGFVEQVTNRALDYDREMCPGLVIHVARKVIQAKYGQEVWPIVEVQEYQELCEITLEDITKYMLYIRYHNSTTCKWCLELLAITMLSKSDLEELNIKMD